MNNPDILLADLIKRSQAGAEIDWSAERERMRRLLVEEDGMRFSKKAHEYRKLIAAVGERRDLAILDYGCGGGQLVLYLSLLGFETVLGVDVGSTPNWSEVVDKLLGELPHEPRLRKYDGHRLPYEDGRFDVVISEMVVEHVQDLPAYYGEAARVLKPGGVALLDFMHRLVPYDSHARRWFIHWFPRPVRGLLYDRLTKQGSEYYDKILNLRCLSSHRRLALNHFSEYANDTHLRLAHYDYAGKYEGSFRLRMLMDRCINLPVLGRLFLALLAPLACADIRLTK